MAKISLLVAVLFMAANIYAQDSSGCRNPAPMAGFNVEKIFGTWYKLQIGNFGYQPGLGCATDTYSLYGRTDITYTSLFLYQGGQLINQTSQFKTNEFYYGFVSIPGKFDLRIIDTDYMNYLVWYICDTSTGIPVERVASATRLYFGPISQLTQLRIQESFRKIGYDPNTLQTVDRSLCSLLPFSYPN